MPTFFIIFHRFCWKNVFSKETPKNTKIRQFQDLSIVSETRESLILGSPLNTPAVQRENPPYTLESVNLILRGPLEQNQVQEQRQL